jgi:CrcB protein
MSVNIILSVAAGGAIGAVGRFLVMNQIGQAIGHGFPFSTLVVNVLGSFILGSIMEISALAWSPSPEVRAMVVVGMLGAFTTFSTFSLDVYYLINRGEIASAWLYITVSVLLSVGAFFGGVALFRQLLS